MKPVIAICLLCVAAALSSCASGNSGTLPFSSGPIAVGMRGDNFLRQLGQGGQFSCEGRTCRQEARFGTVPVSAEFTMSGDPSSTKTIFIDQIRLRFSEYDYKGMLSTLTDLYGKPVHTGKVGISRRAGLKERQSATWSPSWGKITLQSFVGMKGQSPQGEAVMTGHGIVAPQ